MSEYTIPEEYYFRIHHCRPRFKGNVENVLIYMATEITRIGDGPKNEFNNSLNNAIRCFPGNATLKLKTINNRRTEISSFFGLFYEDKNHYNHAMRRAKELAENNDLVEFFKLFLYYFQYPGAHIKGKDVLEQVEAGIHFKPAQYILKLLKTAEEKNGKRCGITKEEACYCIFNDLRCTRDNEDVIKTWERIQKNRELEIEYIADGDVTRYAGDILDYMQYANLLVSYNNKEFFINHNENEAIIKYINSTEWFSGYDKMIKSRKGLNLQLNEIQTIERKIARNLLKLDENVIWMAKDSGSIYKLNSYDKNNNNSILTIFKKLRVKGSVLDRFGEFLKGDKDKFYFDFFYMAESKDKENIEIIKEELGNYGLLLLIDYQARRNS